MSPRPNTILVSLHHLNLLTHQVMIFEPLAKHPLDDVAHLVDGVGGPVVVAALELRHVASQVLGAHLMVDAVVAALERGPEAFDAVRVGLLSDVLADAVPDGLVGWAGRGRQRGRRCRPRPQQQSALRRNLAV